MTWKQTVNRALARGGYQLNKLPKDGSAPKTAKPQRKGRGRKRSTCAEGGERQNEIAFAEGHDRTPISRFK